MNIEAPSILDNRFNEQIFKYHIKQNPSLKRMAENNEPFVLELMDRIYTGQNNPDYMNHDYISKLSEISFLNINMKGCIGSIIATTELAESIASYIEMNKDVDPENQQDKTYNESLADMVKIFSSKRFMDQVSASNEAQDKVDNLFVTSGDSLETEDVSHEEIQIRKNILNSLKNKNYRTSLNTIMDSFGYFYAYASKIKKEDFTSLPVTPTDITLGNDIKNFLPSELGLLDSEELLPLFVKKVLGRECLQFDLRSKENVGKGDIVIGLDISDSMTEAMYNSPIPGASKINVALGFCLAILKILKEQNRNFKLFTFNYDIVKTICSKQQDYYNSVMDIIGISVGGGTDLVKAIDEGFKYSKEKYDFIMVSDCEFDIPVTEVERLTAIKEARFSVLVIPTFTSIDDKIFNNIKKISDSLIVNNKDSGFSQEIEKIVK